MTIVVAMKALNLGVIFELALQLSPISDVSVVSCYGVESPLAHWCSRGSDVKTSDMQIVTECQSIFNFRLPSVILPDRCESFRVNYESCNNSLYKLAPSPL